MASVDDSTKIVILFLDENNHLRMRSANVSYAEAHLMLLQEAKIVLDESME